VGRNTIGIKWQTRAFHGVKIAKQTGQTLILLLLMCYDGLEMYWGLDMHSQERETESKIHRWLERIAALPVERDGFNLHRTLQRLASSLDAEMIWLELEVQGYPKCLGAAGASQAWSFEPVAWNASPIQEVLRRGAWASTGNLSSLYPHWVEILPVEAKSFAGVSAKFDEAHLILCLVGNEGQDYSPILALLKILINYFVAEMHQVTSHETAQKNERKLQALLDNSSEYLFSLDDKGRIEFMSASAKSFLAGEEKHWIGLPFASLVHAEDRLAVQRALDSTLAYGGMLILPEYRVVDQQGERWHQASGGVVVGQKQAMEGLILVARDISEQRAWADRLLKSNLELEERVRVRTSELEEAKWIAESARRDRDLFLSGLQHDIRTPMNDVLGLTHLLLQEDQENPMQLVRRLKNSAQKLMGTLGNLLDHAQISAGEAKVRLQAFKPLDLIQEVIEEHRTAAEVKGLNVQSEYEGDLPGQLWSDSQRLHQVLSNLLTNAIKYTWSGQIKIFSRFEPEGEGRVRWYLQVKDTGLGMDPTQCDQLFQLNLKRDPNHRPKGLGLGLWVSREWARLMGGDLAIRSALGQGTVVELSVLCEASEISPEQHASELGLKILLVEDDPINRLVESEMLRQLGHEVTEVSDGFQALEWLELKQDWDLLLLDLHLPLMNGAQICQKVKLDGRYQKLPVLGLTADAEGQVFEQALESGMNDWLVKPLNPNHLREKIQYLNIQSKAINGHK
jgi:PAS domain S-box-containing protein